MGQVRLPAIIIYVRVGGASDSVFKQLRFMMGWYLLHPAELKPWNSVLPAKECQAFSKKDGE